jgi:hypothetical protein
MYANGIEGATDSSFGGTGSTGMDGTGPVRVGNYQWDGASNAGYLVGAIDQVLIWKTIRTEAEICADAGGVWDGAGPTCTLF